jgi:cystathionine beta-lyase/cystathionine gamma-synthase
VSNPTVSALERALGAIENALPAVCFASGIAAETALFLGLLRSGDRIVCARVVYGGTTRFLEQFLAPLGVEVVFVDATDLDALAEAVTPGTRLLFLETPANPTLSLTDLRAAAAIGTRAGALVAVDNTFQTAVLQRPLDLGADITVTSTTKFIEGHSGAIGGALVTRDPDLLERFRFVRKSTGGIQTPLNAWLTLQGIKTLPLRLRAQSANAHRIAEWLEAHPLVSAVHYPGLASFPQRELADSQHIGAHGAVLSFEVVGGVEAAQGVLRNASLCALVEHVGSVETLLTHPATMTHADVDPDERRAAGIGDGLIRLSVGLEDPADVIRDLSNAIETAHEDALIENGGGACLVA